MSNPKEVLQAAEQQKVLLVCGPYFFLQCYQKLKSRIAFISVNSSLIAPICRCSGRSERIKESVRRPSTFRFVNESA